MATDSAVKMISMSESSTTGRLLTSRFRVRLIYPSTGFSQGPLLATLVEKGTKGQSISPTLREPKQNTPSGEHKRRAWSSGLYSSRTTITLVLWRVNLNRIRLSRLYRTTLFSTTARV